MVKGRALTPHAPPISHLAIPDDVKIMTHAREKVLVVRYHKHASLEVLERFDQCINRLHVEVVGLCWGGARERWLS